MGAKGAETMGVGLAMLDERAFLVMNAIYLKKMASVEAVADIAGLPVDEARALADSYVQRGLVLDMGGQLLLETDGTAQVLKYYRQTYAELRERDAVLRWYERFETVNAQFIKLVTEWQQTDGDPRTQERLIRTVERLTKAIGELTPLVPRYASYVRRFERGMTLVDQEQRDFVCSPTVDSLHNIWFEFHEDILAVLGRPRDT
jgi:hypothetical protein